MKINLKIMPVTLFLLMSLACAPALAQSGEAPTANGVEKSRHVQAVFDAPGDATIGLVAAMRSNNWTLMHEILGHEAKKYLQSKDASVANEARVKFLDAFDEKSRIEMKGPALAVLHVGNDDWPLPFPLVRQNGKWHFDGKAGIQEWIDRRVGANELSAMQVALAYVDAQREFVQQNRIRDNLSEYAQRIVSTEGKHDGLYWPNKEGEPLSPMGHAFAAANKSVDRAGTLQSKPYHGYYFRILTEQGKAATGGEMRYQVKGKLLGGFGLIAYPATYGESGIKTFIVNHDAVVYSKDLGAQTETAAAGIHSYNPDNSWKKESPQ